MNQPDRSPEDRFIQDWKEWLQRPTHRQAEEITAQISTALQGRTRVCRPLRLALAAAALVCVAMISVFMVTRDHRTSLVQTVVREAAPLLGDGEVLIWLDERTPLYMTFQLPDSRPGFGGKR